MAKKPNTYFISDTHFGHKNILSFERGNKFNTVQEHDDFIVNLFQQWADSWMPDSTFYCLGDFGDIDKIFVFDAFIKNDIEVHFMRGNHDNGEFCDAIAEHGVIVHHYPIYLSQKLVVSHFPVAVWDDTINVCGHLHGATLQPKNYLNANIHVHNYTPVSMNEVNSTFGKITTYSRKFLEEPWADMYKFTQKHKECISDHEGNIDLSASRAYRQYLRDGGNLEKF